MAEYNIDQLLEMFDDYLKISTTNSISTNENYHRVARAMLLDNNLEWSNIEKINAWIARKSKDKNTYHYRFAIKHFYISQGRKDLSELVVATRRPKRKKVFKFIEKSVLQEMINNLPAKYRKIAFLQVKTGARIGSVLTLRAENIDYNIREKLIYIKIGVGKSLSKRDKEITLRLSKKYENLLKGWTPRPYGFMFLKPECESMDESDLRKNVDNFRRQYDRELNKVGKDKGIEGFSSHYLRHLFADYFLKSGGDALYLKQLFGHAKFETTLGYVSIQDKMADEALIKMEESVM